MADKYYPPETKVYTDAIITVRRPILTEEERAKRMKAIHDAAANVMREVFEIERKKQCQ